MQAVTLFIAILVSSLVMLLRPARAFAVYVITLLAYPTFLVVRVDPLDISAGRIVVVVLLLRCLLSSELRENFEWCRLDTWVTFSAIVSVAVPLISWHLPLMKVLENRSGFLMDTFLAYLAARFCITDRTAMITAVKWIGISLVPLALLGVIESYTGWQPFAAMGQYCPWHPVVGTPNIRLGWYRAVGPFGHPIMFGAAFVLFLPFVYSLRHEHSYWRPLAYLLSGAAVIGALSSMSSGPWMMIIIMIVCLALERNKQWIKPLLVFFVISCIAVEIISNRTLHHVIASYANPIGGASWHRAKLIDLAIGNFGEWWLVGYGGRDPGWGPSLGMTWTDIPNGYIVEGVRFGMLGVIALCGVLAVAVLSLVRMYRSARDYVLRSWYWAMVSLIIVLIISFTSCHFFGQTATLFYCNLGIIGSSTKFVIKDSSLANRVRTYRNRRFSQIRL